MIKFRFHRGGFDDSMKTVVHIETMGELIDVITKYGGSFYDLKFDDREAYDTRNGWNTRDVLIKTSENSHWTVIGQSDGILNKYYL